jgi:uncharacterized membrane protein
MLFTTVLFAHLCALFAAFAASALVHHGEKRLASAGTVVEASQWLGFVRRVSVTFPLAILVLVASGGYLVQSEGLAWRTGWLEASLAGIVLLVVNGPAVIGGRLRRLQEALKASGGTFSPELARLANDPVVRCAGWMNTLLALGIAYLMVAKPAPGLSFGVLAIALVLGVLVGRPGRGPASTAVEPG